MGSGCGVNAHKGPQQTLIAQVAAVDLECNLGTVHLEVGSGQGKKNQSQEPVFNMEAQRQQQASGQADVAKRPQSHSAWSSSATLSADDGMENVPPADRELFEAPTDILCPITHELFKGGRTGACCGLRT